MSRVVAIDLPCGQEFVDALRDVWDRGDAAWAVEQSMPDPVRARAFDVAAPSHLWTGPGSLLPIDGGRPTDDGDALVVMTSGTSGPAKAVVLTHAAVGASAQLTTAALAIDPDNTCWVAGLPVNHIGGLSVISRALLSGAALVAHERLSNDALADARARWPNAALCTSIVRRQLTTVDTSMCRRVLLGGGPAPEPVADNVVVTYGLTETGSGVVYDGRPLPGVEIRIADSDTIELRSPTLARRYRDGTPIADQTGWFRTHDLGSFQPDGRLVVHGRADDVIVTGGRKIWPEGLENLIVSHPLVDAVAVVGRPHPEWGHTTVAVVVPAGPVAPSLADLQQWCEREVPAWSLPREVVLVTQLPTTASGKVSRARVRQVVFD